MRFASPFESGRNALANEEDSDHDFPTHRHRWGALLGLSRSKSARPDDGSAAERGVPLGSDGDGGLSGGGGSSGFSLARVAESAKHPPQCRAADRTVFYRTILQPVP